MTRSRQFAVSALFIGFGWMLAGACSSSSRDGAAGPASGGSSGSGGLGGSAGMGGPMLVQSGSTNGGSADNINPLCGVGVTAGTCVPDETDACSGYVPPSPTGAGGANAGGEAAGGLGGAGGDGGMSGGSAMGGAPNGAGGAHGGESHGGEGTVGGAAGAAGEGGANNPPGLAQYSCQVARESNHAIRQCVLAGTGTANAPCFSAADCASSLACVSEGDAGRCLPYCCKLGTVCASNSYCAERPLLKEASDTSNAEPPHVPVCVPADNCSLEDVFPCPAKSQCRCQGDTACMVVRNDGTTTCLKPGTGEQGDPCPCAWNHVCSSVTHQCVKICNTDPTKSDCGQQKCQASSELPPNFGVCVGPVPAK